MLLPGFKAISQVFLYLAPQEIHSVLAANVVASLYWASSRSVHRPARMSKAFGCQVINTSVPLTNIAQRKGFMGIIYGYIRTYGSRLIYYSTFRKDTRLD